MDFYGCELEKYRREGVVCQKKKQENKVSYSLYFYSCIVSFPAIPIYLLGGIFSRIGYNVFKNITLIIGQEILLI